MQQELVEAVPEKGRRGKRQDCWVCPRGNGSRCTNPLAKLLIDLARRCTYPFAQYLVNGRTLLQCALGLDGGAHFFHVQHEGIEGLLDVARVFLALGLPMVESAFGVVSVAAGRGRG
jgi:hypothetical protein